MLIHRFLPQKTGISVWVVARVLRSAVHRRGMPHIMFVFFPPVIRWNWQWWWYWDGGSGSYCGGNVLWYEVCNGCMSAISMSGVGSNVTRVLVRISGSFFSEVYGFQTLCCTSCCTQPVVSLAYSEAEHHSRGLLFELPSLYMYWRPGYDLRKASAPPCSM